MYSTMRLTKGEPQAPPGCGNSAKSCADTVERLSKLSCHLFGWEGEPGC